jgi:hypothetical protein
MELNKEEKIPTIEYHATNRVPTLLYLYINMRAFIYIFIYLYIYMCVYYIYMYICICVYIYIYKVQCGYSWISTYFKIANWQFLVAVLGLVTCGDHFLQQVAGGNLESVEPGAVPSTSSGYI